MLCDILSKIIHFTSYRTALLSRFRDATTAAYHVCTRDRQAAVPSRSSASYPLRHTAVCVLGLLELSFPLLQFFSSGLLSL